MRTIVDTGAIFAMLDRKDWWHAEASRVFAALPMPLYTCEAVITETCFLLHSEGIESGGVLGLVDDGIVEIDFKLSEEVRAINTLMKKYESVPMSLADACLVRMSEMYDAPVFTFDTDFRIYRRNRRGVIPLIGIDN